MKIKNQKYLIAMKKLKLMMIQSKIIYHIKKRKISLNSIPKNKNSSTNILYDSFVDDTKSKSSCVETKKKEERKK